MSTKNKAVLTYFEIVIAINEMFWPKNALVHMANNCTFSRRNDILS